MSAAGLAVAEDPDFEREQPHDLGAERCVLGGMLLDGAVITEVMDVMRAGDHYRPAHQLIHDVILEMRDRGEPADVITVAAELTKRGDISRVGGQMYLLSLIEIVPTAVNAAYYARIVRENAVLRRLIEVGTRLVQFGYSRDPDPEGLLDRGVAELRDVLVTDSAGDEAPDMNTATWAALDLMEHPEHAPPPVWSGYLDLDYLLGGLKTGLYVIAARPAMGKSTVASDLARWAAIHRGRRVVFYSLEMPRQKLIEKIICAEAQVSTVSVERHELGTREWDRIRDAAPRIAESPYDIQTPERVTPGSIDRYLQELVRKGTPADMLIVDYLQLISPDPSGGRDRGREQEVAGISLAFKKLSTKYGIPFVILAQLNRGPESRTDKRPMLSDLRESGSLEQDSDVVILLFREDAYDPETPRAGEMDLIVAKNRYGPTGIVTMAAQLHFGRMADMARQ